MTAGSEADEDQSPKSTERIRSRHAFLAHVTAEAPKRPGNARRPTCGTQVDDHVTAPDSDSDSDSLADLEETPTKTVQKQRTMPTRQSRAVRKYYADDDEINAGTVENSDDEFDPFKLREEAQKKEARKRRSRRYTDDYESEV